MHRISRIDKLLLVDDYFFAVDFFFGDPFGEIQ